MKLFIFVAALFATSATAFPAFQHQDGDAVPVDFEEVHLGWTFDPAARTAEATATVVFTQSAEGYPVFDLIPNPTAQTIDGASDFTFAEP